MQSTYCFVEYWCRAWTPANDQPEPTIYHGQDVICLIRIDTEPNLNKFKQCFILHMT